MRDDALQVHVRIGRLVLDGLPVERRQADLIARAAEAELARLFASRSPAAGTLGRVRGGDIVLAAGAAPRALGAQVARSVHGAAVRRGR